MPPVIQKIHHAFWDDMGRPIEMNSYENSVGCLLAISGDYNTFVENYKSLFVDTDVTDIQVEDRLQLVWHCYLVGMKSLATRLGIEV